MARRAPLPLSMLPLVIDKSFAHASKTTRLVSLAKDYFFLVPTAFYFELFTTNDLNRRAAAQGFPEFQRVHLPILLRQERETGLPATSLDRVEMRISQAVAKIEFRLDAPYAEIVERHRNEVVEPLVDFWTCVIRIGVPGFTKEELAVCHGPEDEFTELCKTLQQKGRIRMIAEQIEYPHAARIDSNWIQYRQLQAMALQGLVVRRRYPNLGDNVGRKKMEHDVQDLEYLTLGLHAGRLATKETSTDFRLMPLQWRFQILEPDGEVITS